VQKPTKEDFSSSLFSRLQCFFFRVNVIFRTLFSFPEAGFLGTRWRRSPSPSLPFPPSFLAISRVALACEAMLLFPFPPAAAESTPQSPSRRKREGSSSVSAAPSLQDRQPVFGEEPRFFFPVIVIIGSPLFFSPLPEERPSSHSGRTLMSPFSRTGSIKNLFCPFRSRAFRLLFPLFFLFLPLVSQQETHRSRPFPNSKVAAFPPMSGSAFLDFSFPVQGVDTLIGILPSFPGKGGCLAPPGKSLPLFPFSSPFTFASLKKVSAEM